MKQETCLAGPPGVGLWRFSSWAFIASKKAADRYMHMIVNDELYENEKAKVTKETSHGCADTSAV